MVCTGNICRSPAMHYLAQREWGDAAEVTSAGIYAEIGIDVPSPMRRSAELHGLVIPRHRPTQLDRAILSRADLVLVATQQHARWIEGEWGGVAEHSFGIKEAAELAGRADAPVGSTPRDRLANAAAALHAARLEEPAPLRSLDDPWSRDQATFDRVMDEIVADLAVISRWAGLDSL
jgi:protein-tyrosine phosphatase